MATPENRLRPPSPLPRFLAFPVLALGLHAALIVEWEALSWPVRWLGIVAASYCWFCVSGSFHETVHQTLFRSPRWNVLVGRAIGIFILIPYTAYRETHRTHHAWLNTPDDWELWPYSDPKRSLAFRRMFVWVDVLFGVVTAPVIYGRLWILRPEQLPAASRRIIAREYVVMASVWLVGTSAVLFLGHRGMFDWSRFHPLWILPLVLSAAFNTMRKFMEHLGMSSTDPVLGTRTIRGPGLATRIASYWNFDIAIHGPHHRYPRSRHDQLPERLRELQARSESSPPPVFPTFAAALRDTVPHLWLSPSVGPLVLRDRGASPANGSPQSESPAPALAAHDWDRVPLAP